MRIGNNNNNQAKNREARPHRDLANFAQLLQQANSDGKIDAKEKQQLSKAFGKLEGKEKKVAKKMLEKANGQNSESKGANRPDGKRDVQKFKEIVKKAMEDGKVTSEEKAQIQKAFERLEPQEKKATIGRLAEHGHQRLAVSLAQSVNG